MFKVYKNRISITRGDSAYIGIRIMNPATDSDYVLQDGDAIQAQVRTIANTGELLIDASIENGKIYIDDNGVLTWRISPEDTRELDIGTYAYDVQLVTGFGDVFTFIENSPFKVTDEVTWHE